MEIYTKHPIRFTVSRIGTESMASGIKTGSSAGWAYDLVFAHKKAPFSMIKYRRGL